MPSVAFMGAGSVVFTELADLEIRLHDIDRERLAVAEGTARQVNARLGAHATIVATTDRAAALDGVGFVVNMVQIGGIDATRLDGTLQLGITSFQGTRRTEWSLLMAANVVATLPLILFFLAAQKQFVQTMTFSGLKG